MKLFEIDLTQKDIQHLQAQYAEEVDGALFFRYDEFMTDLREACNPLPDNPRVMFIIQQLRDKIAQKISGGAFEIRRAFRCFDKDGSGQITSAEFKEVLEQYNIIISEEDLQELMKYIDSEGFGFVGYYDFVEKCLPKDYVGPYVSGTEKGKSYDGSFSSARKIQTSRPPVDVNRLYQKIRAHISTHRIRLSSFLRDGDRHNSGALTRDQFHRALTNAGILVDENELDTLCSAFSHSRHSGCIDWHSFDSTIDSVFVPRNLERAPGNIRTIGSAPIQVQHRLSPEQDEAFTNVMSRIFQMMQRTRFIPKPFFQDYDRVNRGRVTKKQFQRVLGLTRMQLSEAEFRLLFDKFEAEPDSVDYVSFCGMATALA